MLVLFGVGLTLGNVWGGKAADRSIDRTLILSLAGLIAVLLVFPLVLDWPLPTALAILVWGAASFALVPPLQMRVMEAAKDAPNLASAVNIGAFNLGNAIGAALGGAVINAGLGYPAISLAGAAMAALGLVLVLLFAWRGRGVVAGGRLRCSRPEPWGALRPSIHFLAGTMGYRFGHASDRQGARSGARNNRAPRAGAGARTAFRTSG